MRTFLALSEVGPAGVDSASLQRLEVALEVAMRPGGGTEQEVEELLALSAKSLRLNGHAVLLRHPQFAHHAFRLLFDIGNPTRLEYTPEEVLRWSVVETVCGFVAELRDIERVQTGQIALYALRRLVQQVAGVPDQAPGVLAQAAEVAVGVLRLGVLRGQVPEGVASDAFRDVFSIFRDLFSIAGCVPED